MLEESLLPQKLIAWTVHILASHRVNWLFTLKLFTLIADTVLFKAATMIVVHAF